MEFFVLILLWVLLAITPALIAIHREKPVAAIAGYFALSAGVPVIGWLVALYMALESDV